MLSVSHETTGNRYEKKILAIFFIAVCLVAIMLWLRFSPSSRNSFRSSIDFTVAAVPQQEAAPEGMRYIQKSDYINREFVREYAQLEALNTLDGYWNTAEYPHMPRQRGLVNFYWGRVTITTADGDIPITQLRRGNPSFQVTGKLPFLQDMLASQEEEISLAQVELWGEDTNDNGIPLRWLRHEDTLPGLLACSRNPVVDEDLEQLLNGTMQRPLLNQAAQAGRFRAFALRYAEKYKLPASLILAIMHTESDFNPFAVSRSQAIGLMQVVPHTAGTEVYRYLTGIAGKPTAESLFTPETNIKYGSTYLYLLSYRYFGYVYNISSRQFCMMAAYNAGPGAVLRMFHPDRNRALERINAMSPSQVYAALTSRMPSSETRRYVELVTDRMRMYSGK